MTETLINEIMQKSMQRVPVAVRERESDIFRQSLRKAAAKLGEPLTPWGEGCLRRMGEQFTVFQGQAGQPPEKRKR
jgi:hypothetical protein